MNTSAPVPPVPPEESDLETRPSESRFEAMAKRIARLGLAVAAILLLSALLVGLVPLTPDSFGWLNGTGRMGRGWISVAGGVSLLVVLLVLWLVSRRGWLKSWVSLTASYAFLVPALAWLAWDEPQHRELVLLGPPAMSAEANSSWEATLLYTQRDGRPAPRKWSQPRLTISADVAKPELWKPFIEENREEIRSTWSGLPERQWLAELNRYPRIADLAPASPAAPIMRFQPFRIAIQYGCAYASVLAIEGRVDDAIEALLPIIEVSRKIEPESRTLVRSMMARVAQRMTYNTARFVLAQGAPSPEAKARLLAALRHGADGASLARRAILAEYDTVSAYLHGFGAPDAETSVTVNTIRVAGRLVYNPHATVNLLGARLEKLSELAAARDIAAMEAYQKESIEHDQRFRIKNRVGMLFVGLVVPSYGKVIDSFWKTEDLRVALIAELAAGK